MSDFVRVRDLGTGHEYTIRSNEFDADLYAKVDSPALLPGGERVPVKYRKRLPKAVPSTPTAPVVEKAAKSAEQSDTLSKEN